MRVLRIRTQTEYAQVLVVVALMRVVVGVMKTAQTQASIRTLLSHNEPVGVSY